MYGAQPLDASLIDTLKSTYPQFNVRVHGIFHEKQARQHPSTSQPSLAWQRGRRISSSQNHNGGQTLAYGVLLIEFYLFC